MRSRGIILQAGLAILVCHFGSQMPKAYAGNTTCASSQLDWYTSVVGESPCE